MKMVFPSEDEVLFCSAWCAPIHKVADAIRGQRWAKWFVIEDFMCMGKVVRRGKPDIILNKHTFTRRYLNLDAEGRAYRYVAPREYSERTPGRYVPHADLIEAIDHLELHLMPWMGGGRRSRERLGLTYAERFDHPDVIAWCDRREERARRRARRPLPLAR